MDGRPAQLSRHALRTPLLAIRGASELLLSGAGGPLAPAARELLAASGEAALRLERLVEPLLRVAERAGGPAGGLRPVDAAALLEAAGIEAVPAGSRGPGAASRRARGAPATGRGRPGCLVEALRLAAVALGEPRWARIEVAGRSGAVALWLDGPAALPEEAEERPLLLGLAARLARLGGGRLVGAAGGAVGLVLRPVRPVGAVAPGTRPRPAGAGTVRPGRTGCGAAVTP